MTFENKDGVLIIDTGVKLIGSTTSHTLEQTHSNKHMRLTFGALNVEFEEKDIKFEELIKLLPR
jgi:hypothetical protein